MADDKFNPGSPDAADGGPTGDSPERVARRNQLRGLLRQAMQFQGDVDALTDSDNAGERSFGLLIEGVRDLFAEERSALAAFRQQILDLVSTSRAGPELRQLADEVRSQPSNWGEGRLSRDAKPRRHLNGEDAGEHADSNPSCSYGPSSGRLADSIAQAARKKREQGGQFGSPRLVSFAPGVRRLQSDADCKAFLGSATALVSAGLVEAHWMPGSPGCNKKQQFVILEPSGPRLVRYRHLSDFEQFPRVGIWRRGRDKFEVQHRAPAGGAAPVPAR